MSSLTPDESKVGDLPLDLVPLLREHDGVTRMIDTLRKKHLPSAVAEEESAPWREWQACGNRYRAEGRLNEALMVFHALYEHMLESQRSPSGSFEWERRANKGMPLVWISDCHRDMGHPLLAKRYLMFTACEDAIKHGGRIPPGETGAFWRMLIAFGMKQSEIERYAAAIWAIYQEDRVAGLFPEWIVQRLDQIWMTELPASAEMNRYEVTGHHVRWLQSRLGTGDGKGLEYLAAYLLGAIPGCRARVRERSSETDYDILCALEGATVDFRADVGQYFLCECKDWAKPLDFGSVAKFCEVLDSAKCRFGIIFSRKGISGSDDNVAATRALLKVFQRRDIVVTVVSDDDIELIAEGDNLITLLRDRYERRRFDLPGKP